MHLYLENSYINLFEKFNKYSEIQTEYGGINLIKNVKIFNLSVCG